MAIGVLLVALVVVGRIANHYRDKYQQADKDLATAEQLANERQSTINEIAHRQQLSAALDTKYTKELNDAKSKIDDLRADVAAGRRRLQLHARCVSNPKAATTSVDNDATARLADTAERDYFTLTERLTRMEKQLRGAQEWIVEQCR
ncbi:lysis protein [Hafnia paralvei]|uniref:lysis protein n=1 Tax=Hafnia paralvei TaxID=546367 RepID=UPI0007E42E5A|nr:lysis protein [Hafnia paralvei]